MLWPTPKNFVRSLRCGFDVLLWSQRQTRRLLAPWLGPLFGDGSRPHRADGSALEPVGSLAESGGRVPGAPLPPSPSSSETPPSPAAGVSAPRGGR